MTIILDRAKPTRMNEFELSSATIVQNPACPSISKLSRLDSIYGLLNYRLAFQMQKQIQHTYLS